MNLTNIFGAPFVSIFCFVFASCNWKWAPNSFDTYWQANQLMINGFKIIRITSSQVEQQLRVNDEQIILSWPCNHSIIICTMLLLHVACCRLPAAAWSNPQQFLVASNWMTRWLNDWMTLQRATSRSWRLDLLSVSVCHVACNLTMSAARCSSLQLHRFGAAIWFAANPKLLAKIIDNCIKEVLPFDLRLSGLVVRCCNNR